VLFGTLEISGPSDVADSFAESAAHAMLVSAVFAVAAFALVFVLPKQVSHGYEPAVPSE
jgi:hypothetical protein